MWRAGVARVRDDAKLLCICRDREGRASKRYAKWGVSTLYISFYNEFGTFSFQDASGLPWTLQPLECLPDASQMSPRCLPDLSLVDLMENSGWRWTKICQQLKIWIS